MRCHFDIGTAYEITMYKGVFNKAPLFYWSQNQLKQAGMHGRIL